MLTDQNEQTSAEHSTKQVLSAVIKPEKRVRETEELPEDQNSKEIRLSNSDQIGPKSSDDSSAPLLDKERVTGTKELPEDQNSKEMRLDNSDQSWLKSFDDSPPQSPKKECPKAPFKSRNRSLVQNNSGSSQSTTMPSWYTVLPMRILPEVEEQTVPVTKLSIFSQALTILKDAQNLARSFAARNTL